MRPDGTVCFRVWAPHAERVHVQLRDAEPCPLNPVQLGWHETVLPAAPGDRYSFRLDGGPPLPDPASRHQPDGVHGPSAVVDPARFRWSAGEATWRPPIVESGAVYELHVGTFTPEGTFAAAAGRLGHLADLGITHVEVMPVNAFNGPHGWGYDGVAWYAVHEPYGGPEGFAAFVDACHQAGMAVILDVVHNHLGPSGNYLPEFAPYQTARGTDWGEAINLDGPDSDPVRGFIIGNALAWLRDYHVDALRLDAVHALVDTSAVHLLAELSEAVAALSRQTGRAHGLIAESDRNDPRTVSSREAGGLGLDAQWSDDLHHGLHVALTGETDGYYADYTGLPEVAEAYTRGFVFDGGRYSPYRQRTVGAPLGDLPGTRLLGCLQNHDQVGNRALGERLTTLVDSERLRVAVLLLCAAPHIPMLFMGEEWGETAPFRYFSSHREPELAAAVRAGRAEEFAAFTAFRGRIPDPQDPATFTGSRVDWTRRDAPEGQARGRLWGDLLRIRRSEAALANGRRDLVTVVACSSRHLVVTRADPDAPTVAVLANLGDEPLAVSLPGDGPWAALVDTAEPTYGGSGEGAVLDGRDVRLPGRSGLLCRHQA